MDELQALQSLGLTLPSPAYIAGALLFGLIGLVAFIAGGRAKRPRQRWLGLGLMLYPYIVSPTWLLYAVGVALCGALWWERASRGG